MNRQYKRDRGLPSSIDESRVAKLMTEKHMARYASVSEMMAGGYEPVSDRPGHFRRAHAVWALRDATDGNGFVLVRLVDEPAPGIDPRRRANTTVVVEVQTDEAEPEPKPRDDEIILLPLDNLHTAQRLHPGDDRLKDDEYVPDGGAEAARKKREISKSFGHSSDIGEPVIVTQSFSPSLYGDTLMVPRDRTFEVSGHSAPSPEADQILGLGFDNPAYPDKDQSRSMFTRIRLKDELTGIEIAVLPWEFNRFITTQGLEEIKEPVKHVPSRQRAPTIPGRPINTREESAEHARHLEEDGRAAQLNDDTVDLGYGDTAPEIPPDPRAPTRDEMLKEQERERQYRMDRGVPAEETMDLSADAKPTR